MKFRADVRVCVDTSDMSTNPTTYLGKLTTRVLGLYQQQNKLSYSLYTFNSRNMHNYIGTMPFTIRITLDVRSRLKCYHGSRMTLELLTQLHNPSSTIPFLMESSLFPT